MPSLHPDWRRVARRAWSVRLGLLAAMLSGADVVCSVFIADPPVPRGTFALIAGGVSIGAAVARLFAQANLGSPE